MSEVEPHIKLYVKEEVEQSIQNADRKYAIKLVEKIVFYTIGAASVAVLGALLKLVVI